MHHTARMGVVECVRNLNRDVERFIERLGRKGAFEYRGCEGGLGEVAGYEVMLESDSKSRIYVVQTQLDQGDGFCLVLKWYSGKRQRLASS